MSTPNRPSLAPKHTRSSEESRRDALDQGLKVTVPALSDDGEPTVYEVRLGEVTPQIVRKLRAQTGYSFNALIQLVSNDPDADVIACFMWLSHLIAGEDVDLDDITLTYAQCLGDAFSVNLPGKRGVVSDSPEA